MQPFTEGETRKGLEESCDIESCAIRQPAWDGPIMTCYCRNLQGEWTLSTLDLSEFLPPIASFSGLSKLDLVHIEASKACCALNRSWLTRSFSDQHIGNEGGYLECGGHKATQDCLYPYTEADLR